MTSGHRPIFESCVVALGKTDAVAMILGSSAQYTIMPRLSCCGRHRLFSSGSSTTTQMFISGLSWNYDRECSVDVLVWISVTGSGSSRCLSRLAFAPGADPSKCLAPEAGADRTVSDQPLGKERG